MNGSVRFLGLLPLLVGCAGWVHPHRAGKSDPKDIGTRKIVFFRNCQVLTDPSLASSSIQALSRAGLPPKEFLYRMDSIFISALAEDAKVANLRIDSGTGCDSPQVLPSASGLDTMRLRLPAEFQTTTELVLALDPISFRLVQQDPTDTTGIVLSARARYAVYDPKIRATLSDGVDSVSSHHLFGHVLNPQDWYALANRIEFQMNSRLLEFK